MVSVQRFVHGFINDAVKRAGLDVHVSSPYNNGYRSYPAIEWSVVSNEAVTNGQYGDAHDVQVLVEGVAEDALTAADTLDAVLAAIVGLFKAGNYGNPNGILCSVRVESGTVYAMKDGKLIAPSFVSTIRLIIR